MEGVRDTRLVITPDTNPLLLPMVSYTGTNSLGLLYTEIPLAVLATTSSDIRQLLTADPDF